MLARNSGSSDIILYMIAGWGKVPRLPFAQRESLPWCLNKTLFVPIHMTLQTQMVFVLRSMCPWAAEDDAAAHADEEILAFLTHHCLSG